MVGMKTPPIHRGRIENGKFIPDDRSMMRTDLDGHEGKKVDMVIREPEYPGTDKQRKYYFKVIIGEVMKSTGYTRDQAHKEMKKLHAATEYDDRVLYESYGLMSSARREEYHEDIRLWASDFLDIVIPDPNQVDWL